jgi:hypothetical protein
MEKKLRKGDTQKDKQAASILLLLQNKQSRLKWILQNMI